MEKEEKNPEIIKELIEENLNQDASIFNEGADGKEQENGSL